MKLVTAIISVLLILSNVALAQNESKVIEITELLENSDFNGSVLVAQDGAVIFKKEYGIADSLSGEKLHAQSAFELASISKVFTAISIHQLAERGKLKYDDPVSKFFPKLPYDSVTIRGLLSHTSGLFDVYEEEEMREAFFKFYNRTDKPYSNKDYLAFLEEFKPKLLADAYVQSKYSNTGYVLLGLIVEQVSGQEFDDYIEQHIFKKAGMDESFIFSKMKPEEVPDFVKGHKLIEEGIIRTPAPDAPPRMYGQTYGDDDMVSTLDELLLFDDAIRNGKLIHAETLIEALKPVKLKNGANSKYGLGFNISTKNGKRFVGHSGGTTGFVTYMQFGLSSDAYTVIMLSNVRNTNTELRKTYVRIRDILARKQDYRR